MWTRAVAALLALTTVLTFSAPPCAAGDAPQTTSPQPSGKRSLSASAAAHVAALAPAPPAFAQDPAAAATAGGESRSFFRTPTGVAAIVLMVGAASFVAFKIPKDGDKVHSPIR